MQSMLDPERELDELWRRRNTVIIFFVKPHFSVGQETRTGGIAMSLLNNAVTSCPST